jgi:hypothetical protein
MARMSDARTSLTIRCSHYEAAALHHQATEENRTVSACLLRILERSLIIEEKYPGELTSLIQTEALVPPVKPRTKILLRCSVEQADRIRRAAARRRVSISKFVVFALRRHWKAKAAALAPRVSVRTPSP